MYYKALQVKFQTRIKTIYAITSSGKYEDTLRDFSLRVCGMENRKAGVTGNEAETALELECIRLLHKLGSKQHTHNAEFMVRLVTKIRVKTGNCSQDAK